MKSCFMTLRLELFVKKLEGKSLIDDMQSYLDPHPVDIACRHHSGRNTLAAALLILQLSQGGNDGSFGLYSLITSH